MTTMRQTERKELAARESNGVHVSLVWNMADDTLAVRVQDDRNDSGFELAVGDAPPLDVFHHPFAYAAHRGAPTLEPLAA